MFENLYDIKTKQQKTQEKQKDEKLVYEKNEPEIQTYVDPY